MIDPVTASAVAGKLGLTGAAAGGSSGGFGALKGLFGGGGGGGFAKMFSGLGGANAAPQVAAQAAPQAAQFGMPAAPYIGGNMGGAGVLNAPMPAFDISAFGGQQAQPIQPQARSIQPQAQPMGGLSGFMTQGEGFDVYDIPYVGESLGGLYDAGASGLEKFQANPFVQDAGSFFGDVRNAMDYAQEFQEYGVNGRPQEEGQDRSEEIRRLYERIAQLEQLVGS